MFQKIVGNKKFMDQRGVSIIFKEVLLSHSSEKRRRKTFSAVFLKIVGNKKLWIRGEYQYFPEKVCCLTVLKNFVGEPFSVSL